MRITVRDTGPNFMSVDGVDLSNRRAFEEWIGRLRQIANVLWPVRETSMDETLRDAGPGAVQSEQE